MRVKNLLIVTSIFLSFVLAFPVARLKGLSSSLSECNHEVKDDLVTSLSRHFDQDEFDDLLKRGISELFERATGKRRQPRRSKRKGPQPHPTKITFGKAARKDLNDLGSHGKARKKAKTYHRKIVKEHMTTVPGAHTADVARIAHVGGTTPDDPFHATVAYRKKPPPLAPGETMSKSAQKKLLVGSTYVDDAGVTKKGGLHHVYPDQARHKIPSEYADAERARLGYAPNAPIPHKP